ncbi:MAG: sulfurtransferase TusA family protein [Nitrospinae bacterium]|nr:sulfurtransferase TusA family protein [Nitrospinota bacterium]MBF0633796.1 sulfurtransferase TusA family protein [Nitrospinota bacterium]
MENLRFDIEVDLQKLSCGDLIVSLSKTVKSMQDGQVLKARSLDPGAANDIPSWCRMTKNELLAGPCGADNAIYYIKKTKKEGV